MRLCYLSAMRNITVSVPDDIYRQARIRAAEMGRSVSALVSEFLSGLGDSDTEFDRLLAQQNAVLEDVKGFCAADRLSRDELYDRGLR